jgi:hypothetical protein
MEWIGDLERAFAAGIYLNRVPIAIGLAVAVVGLLVLARRRGWGGVARRHPARTAAAALLTLVIVAPLGWYLASPLVLSTTIDQPAPGVATRPSPLATSALPTAQADSPAPRPSATPTPTSTPTTAPTPQPVELAGAFAGADDFHFGRGTARLIETSPGTFVVRLEDFEVRNGPDLFVYVSSDATGYADGALELGRLKADKGNQNYSVPPAFDPAGAASVVIWCRQFSVQFAVAPLAPTGI